MLSIAAAAAAAAVELVTPRNANSLHAAWQLLHQRMKRLFVNVTIFLFGLRAQKRPGPLLAGFACRIGEPDNLITARAEQHASKLDADCRILCICSSAAACIVGVLHVALVQEFSDAIVGVEHTNSAQRRGVTR
jgi:hypothetical protein